MRKILAALILAIPSILLAQGVRIDLPLRASGPNVPVQGGPLPQSLILANSKVSICVHPAPSLGSCTPVTTYTDATMATPCPTNTPIVQLPGSACVSSTGITGNLGFWYAGGTVDYFVQSPYGTQGPFTTTGGTTGPVGPSGPAGPTGPAGGAANISNQANGVVPLATGASTIAAQSHLDDGVTTANTITASRPMTGNMNHVLTVTAPPYNAKCDGSTDDATAIQAAFTDALPGSGNAPARRPDARFSFRRGNVSPARLSGRGSLSLARA